MSKKRLDIARSLGVSLTLLVMLLIPLIAHAQQGGAPISNGFATQSPVGQAQTPAASVCGPRTLFLRVVEIPATATRRAGRHNARLRTDPVEVLYHSRAGSSGGTVFKLAPNGKQKGLHNFTGGWSIA